MDFWDLVRFTAIIPFLFIFILNGKIAMKYIFSCTHDMSVRLIANLVETHLHFMLERFLAKPSGLRLM